MGSIPLRGVQWTRTRLCPCVVGRLLDGLWVDEKEKSRTGDYFYGSGLGIVNLTISW